MNAPFIRPDIDTIASYVPGKRWPDAIKLSSNEVTHPPLPAAVSAMSEAAGQANRYPDMAATELVTALAEQLGVEPSQVAVGCGSSALCQQLVQITAGPGDEVIFPWRSFEAYPIFTQVTGATPVPVPLDDAGRNNLVAMAAAVTEHTRLIFVCNPNNPTGTVVSESDFLEFMAQVPKHIIVALDEAYFEYVRADDTPIATELIGRFDNLVGLRTFSKAYGLAGVRVGYAFGNPSVIEALNKVALPFGVNAVAQAGAIASLNACDELLERTDEVIKQRDRMATQLKTAPSEANFVWLPLPEAQSVAAQLAEAGVIVRAFDEGLRITVTNQAESDTLLAAWESLR
ncbi:histidinol-phosphate aminotransferase [Corynebacterium mustelae]|uniref:Aromatic amino acid aminotransferase n=1 Tax=Corynebacterium mustelae TaxID=571915 RepID=A0A0G3GTH9_9CORY|nr:histidinol-phosphate transaminase [Corynebacterium mustelae]AKK04491.1 histidinol-phosphate aminotransferase [Corynebacterium mustelae]